ncbi:MAG: hypothetical protein P4L33_16480 [Capsulimonadaceae bacterium]|nr:hypothetical protein [Capsulimonadaceae bacterium]
MNRDHIQASLTIFMIGALLGCLFFASNYLRQASARTPSQSDAVQGGVEQVAQLARAIASPVGSMHGSAPVARNDPSVSPLTSNAAPVSMLEMLDHGAPKQGSLTLVAIQSGAKPISLSGTKFDTALAYQNQFQRDSVSFVFDTDAGFGTTRINVPRAAGTYRFKFGDETFVIERKPMKIYGHGPNGQMSYIGSRNEDRPGEEHWYGGSPNLETVRYWESSRPIQDYQPSYRVEAAPTLASGQPPRNSSSDALVVIPKSLTGQLKVKATPLDRGGAPCGSPMNLQASIVGTAHAFASLPCLYGVRTAKIRLSARLLKTDQPEGVWIIKDVPRMEQLPQASLPISPSAKVGPIEVEATAALDPIDRSGQRPFGDQLKRPRDGQWEIEPPTNFDGHAYSGAPSVRTIVRAKRPSVPNGDWSIDIQSIALPVRIRGSENPMHRAGMSSFPLALRYAQDDHPWVGVDDEIAGGNPDQEPKTVLISGTAVGHSTARDLFTPTGGTVVADPKAGQCFAWKSPKTIVTKSGVMIVPLNPVNSVDSTGHITSPEVPVAARQYVIAYLAIKMPRETPAMTDYASGSSASNFTFVDVVKPLERDPAPVNAGWGDVWLPGAPRIPRVPGQIGHHTPLPTLPLMRDHYEIYALRVMPITYAQPEMPPVVRVHSSPSTRALTAFPFVTMRHGEESASPSLPQARPAPLTLVLVRRRISEKRPFTLVVPLHKSFPTGWDPAMFDSKAFVVQ